MDRQTHANLYEQRMRLRDAGTPYSDPRAKQLADQEHAAFAREWAEESPFSAALTLPFAIPGYAAAKGIAQQFNLPIEYLRGTPPSLNQMAAAYRGMQQGLGARLRGLLE